MDPKSYYEETYSKLVFPLHQSEPPDLRIVDGVLPAGKKVLSVGCGEGGDVKFLAEKNEVYGIDVMEVAVEAARRNGIKAIQGNAEERLPYGDAEFDIVVCKDILEHVFYPARVMMEVSRVLKPEGYAIVNVPNHFYYRMRLKILLGKNIIWFNHPAQEWDYFHIRFFTFEGFNQFLALCGFRPAKFFFDWGENSYHAYRYYGSVRNSRDSRDRIRALLFPTWLRSWITGVRPNLLAGSFYAKVIRK